MEYESKDKSSNALNNSDYFLALASTFSTEEAVETSILEALLKFEKPDSYIRELLVDNNYVNDYKVNLFNSKETITDPYTNATLVLTKEEAICKYGDNWSEHLAEVDHIVSLKQRYEETKFNPWLTNDDIKSSSNIDDNLMIVSKHINASKKHYSSNTLFSDTEISTTEDAISIANESEQSATAAIHILDLKNSVNNIIETGHNAGLESATHSGLTGLTLSSILNIVAVINGKKTAKEAIIDTMKSSLQSAITGYALGSAMTIVANTLSNNNSAFLKSLIGPKIPLTALTAIVNIGNTLKKFGNGEISYNNCILELEQKSISLAIMKCSFKIGQSIVPIPIIGGVVGSLVGTILSSCICKFLFNNMKSKEIELQKRTALIYEIENITTHIRQFRSHFEFYLFSYLQSQKTILKKNISLTKNAYVSQNVADVVQGSNEIVRAVNGTVQFSDSDELKKFLLNDSIDTF